MDQPDVRSRKERSPSNQVTGQRVSFRKVLLTSTDFLINLTASPRTCAYEWQDKLLEMLSASRRSQLLHTHASTPGHSGGSSELSTELSGHSSRTTPSRADGT